MLPVFGLFALSLIAFVATLFFENFKDFQILAISLLAASLFLVFREGRRVARKPGQRQEFIIDGSNVMYWRDKDPHLQSVKDVLAELSRSGSRAGVIFDANAGHKLWGRYRDDYYFARQLGLPDDQVLVVGKGTPADPVILAAARENGAKIITNDRYRDWAADYPEITTPGHLVRGGYRNGKLWLAEIAPVPLQAKAAS